MPESRPVEPVEPADDGFVRRRLHVLDAEIRALQTIRAKWAALIDAGRRPPYRPCTDACCEGLPEELQAWLRGRGLKLHDAVLATILHLGPVGLTRVMAVLDHFGYRSYGSKPKDRIRSNLWPDVRAGKLVILQRDSGEKLYQFSSTPARDAFVAPLRQRHEQLATEES